MSRSPHEDISEQIQAREALAEREQHLRLIFESVKDYAIFTVDVSGVVTSWNAGAERIFGYSHAEILGRDGDILWTDEDREIDAPATERATASNCGCADDERWHRRKDGSRFFAAGTLRPMFDESGQIRGFTKVCQDVTAQRQTGRELAEARAQIAGALEAERARLAEVFQRSPAFIAVLSGPDHVFEMANDRYFQVIGLRDILHKPIREALPELALQGFVALLDQVYQSGEPYVGRDKQIFLARRPGEDLDEIYVDFVYQPCRDAQGAVSGVFVHGIDVTERKLAERAVEKVAEERRLALETVRESEARFRQLADAMPQIIFMAQADGHVDYFNEKWYAYTGFPEGSIGYENWRTVHTEEGLRRVLELWPESIRTGRPYEIEYELRRADGEWRWHLGRALPIKDPQGNIVRWFGTNTDIHDHKQLQQLNERLLESERAAREEAERSSRVKDEFLATLSHELRTPLNAILGWVHLLKSGAENAEELEQGLNTIERNARAQTRIIEDLLDMSRIISGKVRVEIQRIELAAVVQAAAETIRPAAETKGVHLEMMVEAETTAVGGDPNRLQQVFWNLLSNAVKFTPRGGSVKVRLRRMNSCYEVTVADTGTGIEPSFLPHVFDRFRQADASTTRSHGGLGLGLAIVKQLVELHGGTVRAVSDGPGTGAQFAVLIPVSPLHLPSLAEEKQRSDREKPSLSQMPDLQGLKILVVDDHPDARALVALLLESAGAEVRQAASSAEALQLFETQPSDLIVSDVGMPGEDGYSLIRKVRALSLEKGGNIPAIALTAYARSEDGTKAVLAGFQLHVPKPVEAAELLTMVATLTGRLPES